MERITKILIVLTFGMSILAILRLFPGIFYTSSLAFPVFFVIIGYILYKEMIRHRQIKIHPAIVQHIIPWLIVISVALLFEGHGMNYSANDIGYYVQGASAHLKSLVYFYDEILSHKILFTGLFGLFFAGALLQISRPFSFKMHKDDEAALGICGVLYGLGLGAALIEGQSPYVGLIAAAIFIPALLFHHQKHSLKLVIRKYPLNYFLALTCITIVILLAGYYMHFGSFVEPSKLLCNWGYIHCLAY